MPHGPHLLYMKITKRTHFGFSQLPVNTGDFRDRTLKPGKNEPILFVVGACRIPGVLAFHACYPITCQMFVRRAKMQPS